MSKKNESGQKRKVGRPTKFCDRLAAKIIKLSKQGKTCAQIAEIVGISETTLFVWLSDNDEFSEAVREARQFANEMVEASLFRKAVGYAHPAVKILSHNGESWEHKYIEHYPPDTNAAIYWLKNRDPKRWRDKQELEHTGPDGKPIEPTQIILNIPDNGRDKKD